MAKDQEPVGTNAITSVPGAEVDITGQVVPPEYDWVRVDTGLGKEWDFERDGGMIGVYVGSKDQATKDPQNPGTMRESTAHQFQTADGALVFVWESAGLRQAFDTSVEHPIDIGDLVRIVFSGRETFTGAKGPQQIKRYDVARAVPRT